MRLKTQACDRIPRQQFVCVLKISTRDRVERHASGMWRRFGLGTAPGSTDRGSDESKWRYIAPDPFDHHSGAAQRRRRRAAAAVVRFDQHAIRGDHDQRRSAGVGEPVGGFAELRRGSRRRADLHDQRQRPIGVDTFAETLYAGIDGTGAVLSQGKTAATIAAGKPNTVAYARRSDRLALADARDEHAGGRHGGADRTDRQLLRCRRRGHHRQRSVRHPGYAERQRHLKSQRCRRSR